MYFYIVKCKVFDRSHEVACFLFSGLLRGEMNQVERNLLSPEEWEELRMNQLDQGGPSNPIPWRRGRPQGKATRVPPVRPTEIPPVRPGNP